MPKKPLPLVFATVASFLLLASVLASADAQEVVRYITQVESITPVGDVEAFPPAPTPPPGLHEKLLGLRERTAAKVNNRPLSPAGLLLVRGTETMLADDAEFHGTPSTFVIGRNVRNPRAQSSLGSTLAEPAAANEGKHIFAMGNTHAEYSIDGGTTWVNVPIPAGPADAPFACCDPDVIYDQSRGVVFWSVLYLNAAQTNGVVRIFVRRTIPGGNTCSYTIDPAGTANNILPDYPHLGLTNKYLYLTTNNIRGGSWVGAQVRRFNIDQMVDCVATTTNVYTYTGNVGQRVFVPVMGCRDTMYWGMLKNNTTFTIFKWADSAGSPSSVDRTITASTFSNPDCRGGVGNFDFIERSTSWSITGFRLRGASSGGYLAFYWNVGPDSAHTQGHVHAAVFSKPGLTLVNQPHIFNNTFCFGYPVVATNERGDIGISIAAGGKSGGGGAAARGFVGIDDEYTAGIGVFGSVTLTASGDRNRSDGRYGDYFTCHECEPCDMFFNATNYALSGGSTAAFVNSRYVEFGRGRDKPCHDGWKDEDR